MKNKAKRQGAAKSPVPALLKNNKRFSHSARLFSLGCVLLSLLLVLCTCANVNALDENAVTKKGIPSVGGAALQNTSGETQKNFANNPLTGLELAEGEATRPVAVMVSNVENALPQRGLSAADIIIEMLCESGESHIMAVYSSLQSMPEVGPVCGLRDQFAQLMLPLNAVPVHIGSTVYAENLLNVKAYQNIEGLYLGRRAFYYDAARHLPRPAGKANDYCWFTNRDYVQAGAEHLGFDLAGEGKPMFKFAAKAVKGDENAQTINIKFWSIAGAQFVYNAESEKYLKNISIDTAAHTDEDGTQLSFENVLVLEDTVVKKQDGYCSEYSLVSGTGTYYTKGTSQPVAWTKGEASTALTIYNAKGEQLEMNTGKTYVAFIPNDGEAYYNSY